MRWTLNCAAALAFALLPTVVNAQQAVGQVLWVSGELASIDADKLVRPLAKGDLVHQGELITTGAGSHAQLLMNDQGLIALRPDSSLRLATYAYQGKNDGSERAVIDLVKGGFRSITGAIGASNKESLLIRARNVLVGIRGTDHETFIVPDTGTYNRVTLGGTYLQSGQGRVDLDPGQVGFAALNAPPGLLQRTPEFMQLTKFETPAGAPFHEGEIAHGKRSLPEHVTMPVLPAQALGDSSRTTGWGKGGRCGGSCADTVRGVAPGVGKGLGRGQSSRP